MNEEFDNFSYKKLVFGLMAFVFGLGLIWGANKGAPLALDYIKGETGLDISGISASISDILKGEEETGSTLSSSADPEKIVSTTSKSKTKKKDLTILIGGDVMFDRRVRQLANKNGYDSLLDSITPLLKSADLAVVNLEGPITTFPSKTLRPDGSTTNELSFTFSPESVSALKNSGIDVVSLANNHIDNFGASGFAQTKWNLASGGIEFFGDPWNSSSTELRIEKEGMKVAFVGYHAFQKGFDRIVNSVTNLRKEGYFVIVMPHWGEEYKTEPTENMRKQALLLAQAGAQAIIGAHSHIIGEHEWLDGIPVYYSLGNLLFDQYFSPEVMQGLMVELHIEDASDGASLNYLKAYKTSTASKSHVELIGEIEE